MKIHAKMRREKNTEKCRTKTGQKLQRLTIFHSFQDKEYISSFSNGRYTYIKTLKPSFCRKKEFAYCLQIPHQLAFIQTLNIFPSPQFFVFTLQFARLFAKLIRPGDSEVTFAVFESSCLLLLPV